MSSEEHDRKPERPLAPLGQEEMQVRKISDPRAMRAIAHPVRLALLEALVHAGTLTATQASELLGESPANCAFHLRTLAKYGYVEEAGGGRGRERPWRRVHEAMNFVSDPDDPASEIASAQMTEFFLDMLLARARAALSRKGSWPAPWRGVGLGESQSVLYLTPEEARRFMDDAHQLLQRYHARADHPERRPPGAMPVETLLFSYPLLHLANGPAADGPAPGGRALEGEDRDPSTGIQPR